MNQLLLTGGGKSLPTPRREQLYWNHLGRQLKMWRTYRIADAHALKLLRLWLGYEFLDLLDEFGRIPMPYFNEVRRRLGYKTFALLLDDVRRSQSFYIVGRGEGNVRDIMAIFSPIWHNYEEADGQLLRGSMRIEESQNESQNDGYSKDINNKEIPTGGNATAIPAEEQNPADEARNMKREVCVRRRIVKDYFTWLLRQNDSEHRSMVDDLLFRIRNPRRKTGEHIPELSLTEEQGREVFQIMVEAYLVPYFQTREEFFKPTYMQHPEKRVYWLTRLFKRYGGDFIYKARTRWRKVRKDLEAEALTLAERQQMQYRPRSPHEWEDPQGLRWYIAPNGSRYRIPPEAEPRPSETSTFNYIANQWGDPSNPSNPSNP